MGEAAIAVWKTRDGKSVPIDEMGDSHLANAIAMLVRVEARLRDTALAALAYAGSTSAEMASYAAEGEAMAMFDGANDARQWRLLMEDEVKRRAPKKGKRK